MTFQKTFPSTQLGQQMEEIARMISLNGQLGVGRAGVFCSLGGFDTHSGQPYQQQFPLMTNYANFNASRDDYADNRGVMLPGVSLSQYGATLAKWFGAADGDLDSLFPTLPSFPTRDVGFMA